MSVDVSQFLQTFLEESFEGLEVMESGLLNLDVGEADAELVNGIFRAAHSIKGGSATFGLSDVASFTHVVETLLDEVRDGRREVTQELVDLFLASVDCVRDMLQAAQQGEAFDAEQTAAVQQRLQQLLDAGGGAAAEPSEAAKEERAVDSASPQGWKIDFRPHEYLFRTGNDPVRILRELSELGEISVEAKLDALPPLAELDPESSYLAWTITLRGEIDEAAIREVFAWVEEDCDLEIQPLIAVPAAVAAEQEEAVSGELMVERRKTADRRGERGGGRRAGDRPAAGDSSSIRVSIDKVDAVINLVGELVITQSMLSTLGEDFEMEKLHRLRDGLAELERNTRELQEDVMRMRMMPISFAFNRFPRMVRDLSAQLGKQVLLEMSGEGTELDKTLIEQLSDPLVHLVRNSMDHGIEPPEERIAAGKPEAGTVMLNAYHKGGNIVIEVRDDGRGLNAEKIRAKAVERGLIQEESPLTEEQIHELIMAPGFSTADAVSDVSGRGVGMDVVRRNIQKLGGSIEIRSTQGEGSCFTVRLPLTLAILDGQSVAVGSETYIVPLISIIESIQVKEGMISHVAGKGETFKLRGDYLPVIRLSDVFAIEARARELTEGLLVVVEGEGRRVGLFVDDLLGQQQVVIKSLEANYHKVEGVSGATILGDGAVALILDIPGLIRMCGETTETDERKRA